MACNMRIDVRPVAGAEVNGVFTYLKSIDWSEPWLQALFGFHVVWLVIIVASRKNTKLRAVILVFLLTLVFCSEYINVWASKNFKLFSKQQYFDNDGLFVSLTFSTPALINCFVIVMNWVWNAASLFIRVKQAQGSQKMKSPQSTAKEESEQTYRVTEKTGSKDSGDKKND